MIAELSQRSRELGDALVVSVYFGGGTPSLWPPADIAAVVDAIRGTVDLADDAEVTLEANPTDVSDASIRGWLDAGVTRTSIGLQSIHRDDLLVLGRNPAMGNRLAAVTRAVSAEFDSVTADLILGIPSGARDPGLLAAISTGVPHLSIYELTIEKGTPLERRVRTGTVDVCNADDLADMYEDVHHQLVAAGYEHYEISSFARPGHRSRHNALYWTGAPYLGLGNGAASLERLPNGTSIRRQNPRAVGDYMAAPGKVAELEEVSYFEMLRDLAWLGLRTSDGVDTDVFSGHEQLVGELVDGGFVEVLGGRVRPTFQGFLSGDGVARRIAARWG